MRQTDFLKFWRELPSLTLGLAWRVWLITPNIAEAQLITAPGGRR